jgi:hypothetical protein
LHLLQGILPSLWEPTDRPVMQYAVAIDENTIIVSGRDKTQLRATYLHF